MEKRQVEILAPAGSFDSMKAAVAAGADAVYMGGSRFGARAYADNPDEKGLLEAIDYVHLHGRRLYMTVNTLFKEGELNELAGYMSPCFYRGLDGVIVQDLGALSYLKDHFPGLELHSSTQMTVTSVYGARMLKELGCSRVVTAREMSLEEIRRIHEEVDIEIESFVHGALCYCYSGQCLMSSLIGGRSGNRGRCAQPCRLPYTVYQSGDQAAGEAPSYAAKTAKTIKPSRPSKPAQTTRSANPAAAIQSRPASLNKGSDRHVLSLKDLCTLDILPDIIEAGVYSLKIEGRMKSPRYTAGVVSIYRKYTDMYLEQGRKGYHVEPEDRNVLLDLFDRGGFTDGYYKRHNGRGMVALKEKPEFREGNQKLFQYLDNTYVKAELREPVSGHVELREGAPSRLVVEGCGVRAEAEGRTPEPAQNQPMTHEKVLKQLNKTGGTPFRFERLTAEITGDLFMPVQSLNELRRTGFEALENKILESRGRRLTDGGSVTGEAEVHDPGHRIPGIPAENFSSQPAPSTQFIPSAQPLPSTRSIPSITVFLEEPDQLLPVLSRGEVSLIYLDCAGFPAAVWKETADLCHGSEKQCWLAFPHIFRSHAQAYLGANKDLLQQAGFDGVLVRALEETEWLKEEGVRLPYGMDSSVYNWNSRAVNVMKSLEASAITMPWELNSRELVPVLEGCRQSQITSELIVYGRAPMMVSAQCIARTVNGCTHRRGLLTMKDRTGAMLPVKNHCAFCYNTIYNPSPLSLLGSEKQVRSLGPQRLRLQFTVEDREQTQRVLDAFISAFVYEKKPEAPFKDFTRGHFKRGVE